MILEGETILINRWEAHYDAGCRFIHTADIVGGESYNNEDGIHVVYEMERRNSEGERINDRVRSCSATPLEEFPVVGENPEIDKERPRYEGRCNRCGPHSEFILHSAKSIASGVEEGEKEFSCMKCGYTFYGGSTSPPPTEVREKVERTIEAGEASEEVEKWAERH